MVSLNCSFKRPSLLAHASSNRVFSPLVGFIILVYNSMGDRLDLILSSFFQVILTKDIVSYLKHRRAEKKTSHEETVKNY